VALLENALLRWRGSSRPSIATPVTRLLIQELAARCRAAGVGFSIVLLHVPPAVEAQYVAYGSREHIDVIDCNQPRYDPVPGEVHPDAAAHRRWGECVAAALEAPGRLPPPSTATPPSGTDRR
jgi:hypothetical protein